MRGRDGADGHLADLAKHHTLQHVQAPVLGDVFPVFGLQPLARHLLEGDLGVAGLLDAVDLPLLGGVDALLDELARGLAPVSCLAQGEHAGLTLQREPVAPSLHAAGLDLKAQAAVVCEPVELGLGFGVATVGVGQHGGCSMKTMHSLYSLVARYAKTRTHLCTQLESGCPRNFWQRPETTKPRKYAALLMFF